MSASFPVTDDPRWRISTATAGQTLFTVPFPFQRSTDVLVWKEDLAGVIHVLDIVDDYTITGAGNPAGGTVALLVGTIAGEKIYRIGEADLDRLTSVARNGKFSSEALDDDLDRMIIALMEFRRDNNRSWKVAFGQEAGQINIGAPGRLAQFDENGGISEGPDASDIEAAQGYAEKAEAFANAPVDTEVEPGKFSGLHFSTKAGESADLAEQWAEAVEDLEVEPGKFSSKHHAAKSERSAAAALASENTVALSSLFVGAIVMRFGPVEPGFIAWGEGGTFNRATYPQLATWLDNNGAALGLTAPQIAAGTIPDWRDYVPRTAGGALGPAVGAFQQDAIQEHRHPNVNGYDRVGPSITMATTIGPAYAFVGSGTSGDILPMGLGNGRMASETRVKSFGVRWQIKASGAAVNQGTVDIMALSSQVATLEQKALRKDVDWSAGLTTPEKMTILKNALQVWEVAPGGVVDVAVAVPQVDWFGLDVYRMLRLKGIFVPATADTNFRWQTGTGSFDTSANYFSHYVLGDSSAVNAAPPAGVTSGTLSAPVGNVNGIYHASINANFFEFNKARVLKFDQVSGSLSNAGPAWKTITITGGFSSIVAGRDRLRLFAASGNIAAGSYFVLEGLRG